MVDQSLYRRLFSSDEATPRAYGLPKVHKDGCPLRPIENRSWLKAAGTVLDGPRVENKGPLFRDTREPTSTSTPTRLNDQDPPASNLTSPAAESAGPSTEPSTRQRSDARQWSP
ncbi:hypothetical protein HPB50_021556 [Hyalomma asiaticum]|uniref:Uncharacterized protein n=1 Tax=Hyalomma asiaticum TaxID=266040 RepID=A0ACB7SWY9_HYAAI|nr:hypothetical protein HPB50_021556 [Hyalomma asiaticum]